MIYRQATEADLPEMKVFEGALAASTPDTPFFMPTRDGIGKIFPVEDFIVAENGKGIVGMVGAIGLNADYWYLILFYTEPSVRGEGIGRGLMKAASDKHKALGRRSAIACPPPENLEMYKNHFGFHEAATMLQWDHS